MSKLNGGIGLGSNGTPVYFANMTTSPMKLSHAALLKMLKEQAARDKLKDMPKMVVGFSGLDLPNGVAGINAGMAGKDGLADGSNLSKEEEITMNVCFKTTSTADVKKWCNDQYPREPDLVKVCNERFCDTCCTTAVHLEKQEDHMEKCVKVCDQ